MRLPWEEIKAPLAARQADIVSGEVIVFVEDECHLVWGDVIGYVCRAIALKFPI